jgi:hypothetical protein
MGSKRDAAEETGAIESSLSVGEEYCTRAGPRRYMQVPQNNNPQSSIQLELCAKHSQHARTIISERVSVLRILTTVITETK